MNWHTPPLSAAGMPVVPAGAGPGRPTCRAGAGPARTAGQISPLPAHPHRPLSTGVLLCWLEAPSYPQSRPMPAPGLLPCCLPSRFLLSHNGKVCVCGGGGQVGSWMNWGVAVRPPKAQHARAYQRQHAPSRTARCTPNTSRSACGACVRGEAMQEGVVAWVWYG